MEIERKFLVKQLPEHLEQYKCKVIEQGYLCKKPTLRIRKSNDDYILTYKSRIGIEESVERTAKVLNEVEVPLTQDSYEHLKTKVDNNIIAKKRYLIPLENNLVAELDVFEQQLEGLVMVEVEFKSEEEANTFCPPEWFGEDVSLNGRYTNGNLSTITHYNF